MRFFASHPYGLLSEGEQLRFLPDGGRYRLYRRHFEPHLLASEIGGEILFGGRFYVLVRAPA